jgi:hypothetical protein
MGALVERSVCTICGKVGQHAHKGVRQFTEADQFASIGNVMFSTVPAPKCDQCQQPMEYLKRGTEWTCRDAICTKFNVPVVTGVGGVMAVR